MTEHAFSEVEDRVQTALAASPIHALRVLQVERQERSLRVYGLVTSFYHKQLAQEVVRSLAGNLEVINSVAVCSEPEAPVKLPR